MSEDVNISTQNDTTKNKKRRSQVKFGTIFQIKMIR